MIFVFMHNIKIFHVYFDIINITTKVTRFILFLLCFSCALVFKKLIQLIVTTFVFYLFKFTQIKLMRLIRKKKDQHKFKKMVIYM